jgi:hypothetical protein
MENGKQKRGWRAVNFLISIFYLLAPLAAAAAQFARPASDVDNTGLYTTAPLWDKLDEASPDDDSTEIVSANNPSEADGTGFEVGLSSLSDPQSSTGHVFRWRAQKQGGGRTVDVSCRLYQGATPVTPARTLTNVGTAYTTDTYTLSGAEADAISDYADLRARCWTAVSGGGPATTSAFTWIELEVPDAPPSQAKPFLVVVSE